MQTQSQWDVAGASNLEAFDQRSQTGGVNIWNRRQIDDQCCRRVLAQDVKEPVAQRGRGIDRDPALDGQSSAPLFGAHRHAQWFDSGFHVNSKSRYTKALKPVIALPTMRFCIWYVPS